MSSSIKENGEIKRSTVAVAIDKDKGSQEAFKWAIENVLNPGESITLLHVKQRFSSIPTPSRNKVVSSNATDELSRELFRPFHCFCTRKHIKCEEILLEDTDIKRAIVECVKTNLFETLVLSASTKSGLMRRLMAMGSNDIPTGVMKSAPDFTTVCVISKGKVVSMRSATGTPPTGVDIQQPDSPTLTHASSYRSACSSSHSQGRPSSVSSYNTPHEDFFRSPFTSTRDKGENGMSYMDLSAAELDISFVGSETERMFPYSSELMDLGTFNSYPTTLGELASIPGLDHLQGPPNNSFNE